MKKLIFFLLLCGFLPTANAQYPAPQCYDYNLRKYCSWYPSIPASGTFQCNGNPFTTLEIPQSVLLPAGSSPSSKIWIRQSNNVIWGVQHLNGGYIILAANYGTGRTIISYTFDGHLQSVVPLASPGVLMQSTDTLTVWAGCQNYSGILPNPAPICTGVTRQWIINLSYEVVAL